MSNTDIIGWGSVALFAIAFYLLYRFITSPPKVLDKLLKNGSVADLQKVKKSSQERKYLESFLNPSKGSNKTKTKLGAVYKINRFQGYLCEAVDIQKYRASGGKRKERHDHKLKFVIMEKTGLPDAFTVSPRPDMNMTFKFAMSMAGKMGIALNEYEEGLSEEFIRNFITNTGKKISKNVIVPVSLQKMLVDSAESGGFDVDIMDFLNNGAGIVFFPEGIDINLSEKKYPKDTKQIKAIINFAEALLNNLKGEQA